MAEPKLHKKPTKAELQAEIDKTLEATEESPQPIEEEQPKEKEVAPSEAPQEETTEEVVEETTEEVVEEAPSEEAPVKESQEPDYKKKFVESTREAQVLHAKNKQLVDAVDEASLIEVTEEDLQKEYGDWDLMTDTEKRLAKESLLSTRRFNVIRDEQLKFKDVEVWNEKVNVFADDPKTLVDHPELEGKVEEFKLFASKPTRRGVDFTDLIPAFLYNESKNKPAPKKGQMFEQGTGGNTKPKPKGDKISTEEGRLLMKTDYNKFKEMLKAGKIELPA